MTEQPDPPDQSEDPELPDQPASVEGEEPADPDAARGPGQPREPDRADQPADEPTQQAMPAGRRPGRIARRWLLGVGLVLVVAAGLGLTGWLGWQVLETMQRDPTRAGVGDCLAGSDDPGALRRVDCAVEDASWRVVGKFTDLPWSEFQQIPDDELCADHPDSELAVWFGDDRDRGPGDVFCLEPLG